jgi:ANTAR domain
MCGAAASPPQSSRVDMTNGSSLARMLARVDAVSPGLRSLPERVCTVCVSLLPVTGAGISIVTAAGSQPLHSTDATAAHLAELCQSTGDGPGREAIRLGQPVMVPALHLVEPDRWPMFTAPALALGVGSLHAIPLHLGAIRLGVLNMYRIEAGLLQGDDLDNALTLADAATLLLLREPVPAEGDDPGWATELVGPQAVVHQAAGMVVAQLDVDIETALLRLRSYAYAHGRSVREVAQDIVDRVVHLCDDGTASS